MKRARPVPKKKDGKDPEQDLDKFAHLPARTRQLTRLQNQAENATGGESLAVQKKIKETSG